MREHGPALILLDLMMPEMDGFQFVETLRQQEAWRAIPVVVLTAKDLTPNDRQRLNGYVERLLQKGTYSQEELLREVRHLVAVRVQPGRSEAGGKPA
jgi:CheY-like chemotaxis protein